MLYNALLRLERDNTNLCYLVLYKALFNAFFKVANTNTKTKIQKYKNKRKNKDIENKKRT